MTSVTPPSPTPPRQLNERGHSVHQNRPMLFQRNEWVRQQQLPKAGPFTAQCFGVAGASEQD